MGEIADALRRARRQRGEEEPEPAPSSTPRREELPPPPAPDGSPLPERDGVVVEALDPNNPAIALDGASTEACRHIALRVRGALEQRRERSVVISSAVRGEGKTTLACDVALGLASLSRGREIALLDLDLRRPGVAQALGLTAPRGVDQVLLRRARLDEVRICVRRPALDVYPGGELHRETHELLVTAEFASMIEELERRYAVVIIDTPPALAFPDANLILNHAGGCIALARSGVTRAQAYRKLIETLPKRKLLGSLLNGTRAAAFSYAYRYDTEGEAPRRRRKTARSKVGAA